ncbi:MAG: DNA primase [Candidatus Doudnabacteria bacterium]|nr:DNA primase [Candidatus Doudnabacteria bacterium]
MNTQVLEIKERLPITEVLADYIQMKKAGVNFKAVCPFHNEKTPSLVISPSKQIWHCFGCGLGGDIFKFIELSENVEFREALKILADRAGIELRKPTQEEVQKQQKSRDLYEINDSAAKYFERVLWESESAKEARDYLKKRGLTDRTIQNWRLGYAPDDFHYLENFLAKKYDKKDIELAGLIIKKDNSFEYFDRFRGRIMFPILNIHGQVVGFTGRLLKEKENAGKYINSPETPIYNKSHELYGLYQGKNIIRKENRCILMEGNMDVVSSHQAGFAQAVASSGTALTTEQFTILKRFCENLIFAFDTDAAGSGATKRALEIALNLGFNVKIVEMRGAKDPDELIKKGIGLWQKAVDSAPNFVEFFFDKTLKEFDPTSVDGKREIVKILAPLIYRMSEPVTRAHFVRKLSDGVNVAESAIWDIINRISLPRPQIAKTAGNIKKSRQEILEDQLLGMTLIVGDNKYIKEFRTEDFSAGSFSVVRVLLEAEKPDLSKLSKAHPEIAEQLELLNFAATVENNEQGLDPQVEVARVAGELKRLILHKRMEEVTQNLMAAEKAKDKNLAEKLSIEFSKLSDQLRGRY